MTPLLWILLAVAAVLLVAVPVLRRRRALPPTTEAAPPLAPHEAAEVEATVPAEAAPTPTAEAPATVPAPPEPAPTPTAEAPATVPAPPESAPTPTAEAEAAPTAEAEAAPTAEAPATVPAPPEPAPTPTAEAPATVPAPPEPAPTPTAEAEAAPTAEAEAAPTAEAEARRPTERPRPFAPPPPKVAMPRPRPTAPAPRPRPAPETKAKPTRRAEDDRARMRAGLRRTRKGFVAKLARLLRGKPKVDDDLRDEVEEILFTADIGPVTAEKLLERVTAVLDRKAVADPDAVWSEIRAAMLEILEIPFDAPAIPADPPPYVLLAIGVNGVGKTTTLGKLAAMHVAEGRKVLLVAGDTFRAAAAEQLAVWARKVGCDVHTGAEGADPASVVFDGIVRGRKEGYDVVLCDTAGRLHTRKELMDELGKVGRAAAKALAKGANGPPPKAPHDTFLVLDATIGQNALAQAKLFRETLPFTGIVVTKLDGTAKGGVVLGICDEMKIPIRYVGVGEEMEDLRPFDAAAFVTALVDEPAAP